MGYSKRVVLQRGAWSIVYCIDDESIFSFNRTSYTLIVVRESVRQEKRINSTEVAIHIGYCRCLNYVSVP